MNLPTQGLCPRFKARGFSLVEISLVICLMLGLLAIGGFSMDAIQDWNKGKNAALALQAVYSAQRSYLADNPTADISTIDSDTLKAYLPAGWSEMPTMTDLNDGVLTLDFSVMPPFFSGSGGRYDPSKTTKDGLWDTGTGS